MSLTFYNYYFWGSLPFKLTTVDLSKEFDSLPNDKILDLSSLKTFADDK